MKFESKFGIGEIVIKEVRKNGEFINDFIYEVKAVVFGTGSTDPSRIETMYSVFDARTGAISWMNEYELIGDPLFDQELGKYPQGEANE